jgi:hypothetical protein
MRIVEQVNSRLLVRPLQCYRHTRDRSQRTLICQRRQFKPPHHCPPSQLDIRSIRHFDSSSLWSDGPRWLLIGYFPILYNPLICGLWCGAQTTLWEAPGAVAPELRSDLTAGCDPLAIETVQR